MRTLLYRYPTAPLAPEVDAALPFRSWLRTADDEAIARYNAALPAGERPAMPTADALMVAEDWCADDRDALWVAVDLLTHPDERVVVELLDGRMGAFWATRFVSAFHAALSGRYRVQADDAAAEPDVVRRAQSRLQYTPVCAAYSRWKNSHGYGGYAELEPEIGEHIRARLAALAPQPADHRLGTRTDAVQYLCDHITGRSPRRRLAEPILRSIIPLSDGFPLSEDLFRRPTAALVEVLLQYGRPLMGHVASALAPSPGVAAPADVMSPDAVAALRRGLLQWLTEEIDWVQQGRPWTPADGAAALIPKFRVLGARLTAAELRTAFGDLTSADVDPRQAPAGGAFLPALEGGAVVNYMAQLLSALAPSIGDGDEADLEAVVLGMRDSHDLPDLLRRVTMTPRVARAVLRTRADPAARATLAELPHIRHDPLVQRRLLGSTSAFVAGTYLQSVTPERFAYAFRRFARTSPFTALEWAAHRWAEIHDYMDLNDFAALAVDGQEAQVEALVATLRRDLELRMMGSDPGPLNVERRAPYPGRQGPH